MEKFKTMREVFDKLKENINVINKISLSEDEQLITAEFHEFLEIRVDNDYLNFRSGKFEHHWHPTPDESYRLLNGLSNGEIFFALYRGGYRMLLNFILVGSRLRVMTKEQFEKNKSKLIKSWSIKRIFSGNKIIKPVICDSPSP